MFKFAFTNLSETRFMLLITGSASLILTILSLLLSSFQPLFESDFEFWNQLVKWKLPFLIFFGWYLARFVYLKKKSF